MRLVDEVPMRVGWLHTTRGRQGETKAGSWGCVGSDPAMVPDAATLLVGWAPQQSLATLTRKYIFENSSHWRIGVTHPCRAGTGNNPILPPT